MTGDDELLTVYREHIDEQGTIEEARESFIGIYASAKDWAEAFLRDTGSLDLIPGHLRNYIDYEAYARDTDGMYFTSHNGAIWVFIP